jgi:hypothetical protein
MAGKKLNGVTVTILGQEHLRGDWLFDFDGDTFQRFMADLTREMRKLGFSLTCINNSDVTITINSYADLLNCVKVSSDDSQGNHCIGHIIGKSEHLDLMEDIGAAVRRIAFAPETIAPAGEFRKVCHNCGCGC